MGGGGGGGEDGDYGFQIAPMVDVVFVLLLFFMACAGQNQKEGRLEIKLPSEAKGGEKTNVIPLVIGIDPLGRVALQGQPKGGGGTDRELSALTQELKAQLRGDDPDPVIIRPTLETPHERVIDVLNACKKANVRKLSFG